MRRIELDRLLVHLAESHHGGFCVVKIAVCPAVVVVRETNEKHAVRLPRARWRPSPAPLRAVRRGAALRLVPLPPGAVPAAARRRVRGPAAVPAPAAAAPGGRVPTLAVLAAVPHERLTARTEPRT